MKNIKEIKNIKYAAIILTIFCVAILVGGEWTKSVNAESSDTTVPQTQVEDIVYRQTTQLPNPGNLTNFGSSVAIDGDVAVVGVASLNDNNSNVGNGSSERAIIFRRESENSDNWILVKEIVASDGQTGDNFGISVAISGETVVVGSLGVSISVNQNVALGSAGGAYIFNRNTGGANNWGEVKKLTNTNGNSFDFYGSRVSISGDTVVVGSFGNDEISNNAGAAFVYQRNLGGTNNWGEVKKLTAGADAEIDDKFGFSVTIGGDGVVVGTYKSDSKSGEAGAAYIFGRNTGGANNWGEIKKIAASDGANDDGFGVNVDLSGETVVVGAVKIVTIEESKLPVGGINEPGAAYIFQRNEGGANNWGEVKKLEPAPTEITNNLFGLSVSIDANTVIVGSLAEGGQGQFGAAYVFNRNEGGIDNWGLLQRIQESPLQTQARFGKAVGVSGDKLIIATFGDFSNGRVYIFTLDTSPTPFDFDGDGKSDLSIFRPAPAEWWLLRSSDGGNNAYQFGQTSDRIVPADFTGDGKTDIAFWREATGEWFILRSEDSSFYSFPFGANGDIPVPADYDGDGIDDAAVFRPSTATWFINNSGGGTRIEGFGVSTDIPIPNDYDGDGKADLAIWRPNGGTGAEFWLNRSTAGVFVVGFGTSNDKPVIGDYTGDGKDDVTFWRPNTGEWFILRSEDSSFYSFPFGANGDIPAPGDYDGDGTFDAAVFRPNGATWFINGSTSGTIIQGFGLSTDRPLANSYVP